MFSPRYADTLVYMLQSTEYRVLPYLRWYWRTEDFRQVTHRRQLDRTQTARLLLLVARLGIWIQVAGGLLLFATAYITQLPALYWFAAVAVLSTPIVWAHLIILPMLIGRVLLVNPRQKRLIGKSRAIFRNHPAITIAIAGSYGKTSLKEILLTVLSEGKKVAATPANRNVASSHAQFAASLTGQEDILIVEYGEGKPGDVQRFAETTQPKLGIITGLAPAHLDQYPTLQAAGEDIFALAAYLEDQGVYVNGESLALKPFIKTAHEIYGSQGVAGWKVKNVKVDYGGISFEMSKASQQIKLHSKLIGRHQVGPLALAAALSLKLGLSQQQVTKGIAKTAPFVHRMQPRYVNGAWIIDDTYNGNIEGIRAGLQLLQDLPARHKTYVTPGLVDQGEETTKVHRLIGQLIAEAQPDRVVLMKNSVTDLIKRGLDEHHYKGELRIEADPLNFYTNIDQFLAHGDLVVMQNDWPDNYN
ncbi:hypothetical protein HY218_01975 [Candidatus Saccharibacteria bacterium]|nr:hypothetical protein [Candidatus Saccharibacteria bacterium]